MAFHPIQPGRRSHDAGPDSDWRLDTEITQESIHSDAVG